ncbi:uncharacterized protein PV09_07998 [Verruconis gallopava]|uniref:Acetylornithine aminotransferase n=1 Tax=Verruconis gallopava TaxID=253628 RepID=A0A0D2A2C5_9PEZI|nr:uncharacterized protein PV09_07998 [Verruconis gallopava]KIW00475.1 hypothetical protein PV09_07998 [Verruconis gallopava]
MEGSSEGSHSLNKVDKSAEGDYLSKALQHAHDAYIAANPLSLQAHQDSANHLPGGNTRTVLYAEPFPLTFVSASGSTLRDIDGHEYVSLVGEYSAGIFGHSHPKILEAVNEAMRHGWNFGGHCTYEKELAKRVVERFRASGIELVRFTNSGTEANTCAIGAAIAFTQRKKVLVFSNAYHGGTLMFSMALMRGDLNSANINLPHEFVFAPFNNIEETQEIVEALPKESLAAIIVEPVQGSGGCRPATREFMLYLRKLADSLDSVLIVDEVMASRLGYNGYSATLGLKADILTLGKYVGGGMTFGAFGGRRDIMDLFDPSKSKLMHPGTYNNNVLTMNAGIAGLDVYNAAEVTRLNDLGKGLKTRIQHLLIEAGVYGSVTSDPAADFIEVDSLRGPTKVYCATNLVKLPTMFVTGKGSMVNVRFSGTHANILQGLFYHHMLAQGISIASRGFTPLHLALSDKDIRRYTTAIEDFINLHRRSLV